MRYALILLAGSLVAGCGGGDPQAPFALADLDQSCLDGGTGRQLLALAQNHYAATLTREGAPLDGGGAASVPPPTALTIDLAYQGGAITCVPQRVACDPGPLGTPCSGPPVAPLITIEMAFTLHSADGELDEQFVAPVDWYTSSDELLWRTSLPATSLHGTYTPTLADAASTTLDFSGTLRGTTTHGGIGERTASESADGATW